MPNVVHCKREAFDVYIGRPTKWGNPFSHKAGTLARFKVETREEAVQKYEQYLLDTPELFNALHELRGKVLGCWCHPKSCHGHILSKYANPNPLRGLIVTENGFIREANYDDALAEEHAQT